MNEGEDNNKNSNKDEKRVSQNLEFNNLTKKRESLIVQKGREFFKNKKAVSMKHIHDEEDKKINININHNINISANINQINQEKRSEIVSPRKPKILENNLKIIKFDNYINKDKPNDIINNENKGKEKDIKNKESRDRIRDLGSARLDKFALKQLKYDTKDEKQEEFIEFYINNTKKNKLFYYLKDNTISTTKYNIFTFIPKGLLYQFSSLSNVYFLFTAIIQSIPIISPLTSLTAIVPLLFVLGVSMIREAIEDLVRNSYDKLSNNEEVIVFRNNKFIKSISKTLRQGEIVLVYENHNIPADMILIDTGFGEGTCYVETSSLDGEKTLKLKVANKHTKGFISDDFNINKGIEKFIQPEKYSFGGYIKINSPDANLNYINGTLYALFSKKNVEIDQNINISVNEFLLKGSILKNTNWIIGIVVYTGMSNKIILNSKKPRLKKSKVEKKLNFYLIFIFMFLIICCAICSLFHHFLYLSNKKFYDNFVFIANDPNTESFIIFFTYFLLLNTLIPISLIVSTEIIKIVQGIFIGWDILLYSRRRNCFCTVKSVSIIEELGNVNFIFSDKTGTLTKNQLQFKYCIIENKYYEYIKIGVKKKKTTKKIKKQSSTNTYEHYYKKSKYKSKKNSFLSENNQLLKNKIITQNLNEHQFKNKNNIIKTENLNNGFVYKKYSGQNLNLKILKIKNENIYFNNSSQQSPHSPKSPKSPKSKKVSNINKSNDNSNNISKSKNKSQSNISIESISNDSKIKSNRSKSNNSESYNISNNSKNNFHDNSIFNISSNINNKLEEILKNQKNSTILEVKNEENEYNSIPIEIIQFGEGYFTDTENNPFLKSISYSNSFNYIHEFWTALTLTNECMIKYDKDDIKYMGTSPDDLELVKIASLQGYKLIETSIDTKVIRISGKDYTYEILKVLGFSSERKRMSIIVKDKNGIKLYTKGADCEIKKRLSKKSIESENYEIISDGLSEFSKKGLRTLMVAYRNINDEDYNSWVSGLYDDEININKQKLIEKLYDIIENNLILLGGTVVEDKLQDSVPETIKELRSAGIKIWVLTGDKLDTAENIGYSCNLLTKEQRLFTLKLNSIDNDENNKEEPFYAINRFFIEFQDFIEELTKKYNLESKYNKKINNDSINFSNNAEIMSEESQSQSKSQNQNESQSQSNKNSVSNTSRTKIIDFEIFKYLKEKDILEPFSIIIESPIFSELFIDDEITQDFLRIAYYSNTVICCRTSPFQKSEIIQKIKNFDEKAITLAIGDGGNDVSMIMEANIGIGIHGEEGMSAVQASDFSIGEFKLLKRLLFIHGRTNLYRISKMIIYFFYKNFIFAMNQFFFSFICLASGQTIIDDWYITCYNLLFTAFPLCVRAITDSDIDLTDEKNSKKNFAILYKENRDEYKIFRFRHLIVNLVKGAFISLSIFYYSTVREILIKGYNQNIWYLSLKCYICILFVATSNLLLNTHFIIYLLPLTIGITTVLFFIVFLILNHYGIFFVFNSKASISTSLNSPLTYLSILFICSFNFILDYYINMLKLFFSKSLSNQLILKNYFQKRKKSYSSNSKLNSSKTNSKHFKDKNNIYIPYDERSRSYLISKSNNPLKVINQHKKSILNSLPKNYQMQRYKRGESLKNDFYSLQILKNINKGIFYNNNNDNSNDKK